MRNGGMLLYWVPELPVQKPGSHPTIAQSLMFQNYHRVLAGWTQCITIMKSAFYCINCSKLNYNTWQNGKATSDTLSAVTQNNMTENWCKLSDKTTSYYLKTFRLH